MLGKYLIRHSLLHRKEQQGPRPICASCYAAGGMFALFLVWAVGGYLVFSRPEMAQFSGFLPGPTLRAFGHLMGDGQFWSSVAASVRRVCLGIGAAFCCGLPLGLVIGYSRRLQVMTYPPIQFIRMISPLSWMPIALLIFHTFEGAIYFLIAMATVWPIMLNTMLGVARVNPRWIDMARVQGATHRQIMAHIILPASTPYILTSLRLALGVAWIVIVPVEFLGVTSGLGYLINDARDTMEYDRLMAIVLAIGCIGFLLDSAIQLLRRLFRWTWVQ